MRSPAKITLIYASFSVIWIFMSDKILEILAGNMISTMTRFQTLKGGLFVVASSLLMYELTSKYSKAVQDRKRLKRLSEIDPLTGLFNRRRFYRQLARRVYGSRRGTIKGAVLYIDLDGFKEINDTLGHAVGDKVLKIVANVLNGRTRKSDMVSRVGGDEFAILLYEVDEVEAEVIAVDILKRLNKHSYSTETGKLQISCSIGIALFPRHGTRSREILQKADYSMYQAKSNEDRRICVFEEPQNVLEN